jgi:hypothetical protein
MDTYDFDTGARLAFDRLVPKEESEPTKPLFDWDAFKSGKIAVHCDTEEKAKAFLAECEQRGLRWHDGQLPTKINPWSDEKVDTCIIVTVLLSRVLCSRFTSFLP